MTSTTPTLRAFITVGAALTATAAAPLALAGTPNPDRVVKALVQGYREAEKAHNAAWDAYWSALEAMNETPGPEIPAALRFCGGNDLALGFRTPPPPRGWKSGDPVFYTAADVEMIRGEPRMRPDWRRPTAEEMARGMGPQDSIRMLHPWPEAQARADEIVAAWDALQAAHDARRQAFDLPRLEHEERAASEAYRAAWKALAARPAATLAGAAIKARIAVECHDGLEGFPRWVEQAQTTDEALAFSAVLDLARLAPSG